MNIRKLFTRISGDNADTRHFMRNNPDCPQFLREAAASNQIGQPGFGPPGPPAQPLPGNHATPSLSRRGAETPPKPPHQNLPLRHPLLPKAQSPQPPHIPPAQPSPTSRRP